MSKRSSNHERAIAVTAWVWLLSMYYAPMGRWDAWRVSAQVSALDLAVDFGVSDPTIHRALVHAVTMGWLGRYRDGRGYRYHLTEGGARVGRASQRHLQRAVWRAGNEMLERDFSRMTQAVGASGEVEAQA